MKQLLRGLIVQVEGPETTRVEDLILTTTITNTGSETLRLVNEPTGVLYSRLPTEQFYVTHSTRTVPQFKGVRVKFSL
ncbi:hypothetical protein AX14_008000 [Amanita brunnescens Koide BX004]|nr:hypothetical protein AX14_008000 [Amanita brunnescens Koide BX004]